MRSSLLSISVPPWLGSYSGLYGSEVKGALFGMEVGAWLVGILLVLFCRESLNQLNFSYLVSSMEENLTFL